jgi:outer membrane lipoprotein carrier protein
MQKFLIFTILMLFAACGFAQNSQFTKPEDSDPAATAILEKVRQKYEAYKTLEADFTLILEIPERSKETQKGKMIQEGEKYRLELEAQTVVSDGITIWFHLKNNDEVQINCVEEEEDESVMSPKDLFRVYETESFVYTLSNEYSENGKLVQQIDFKPLDKDSEYSKMQLTVAKKTAEIVRIKAFSKDGSRYTLIVGSSSPNKAVPASTFIFEKSECPDCHYEDLRIDC